MDNDSKSMLQQQASLISLERRIRRPESEAIDFQEEELYLLLERRARKKAISLTLLIAFFCLTTMLFFGLWSSLYFLLLLSILLTVLFSSWYIHQSTRNFKDLRAYYIVREYKRKRNITLGLHRLMGVVVLAILSIWVVGACLILTITNPTKSEIEAGLEDSVSVLSRENKILWSVFELSDETKVIGLLGSLQRGDFFTLIMEDSE